MIVARGLVKAFGSRMVLDRLDFEVPAGSITAFVGPNGSGKTTLNKALLGLVRLDAGRVTINGQPVNGDVATRRQLGYMPQRACFPEQLAGHEVLALLRSIRAAEADYDGRVCNALGLHSFLDKPVRVLSGGQRQRLSAACALVFRPAALLLDEPTAGLDPLSAAVFKNLVREARDRGAAVLVTSHILSEVAELADRVIVLLDGRARFEGSLATLAARDAAGSLEGAVLDLLASSATAPAA
ncbi:MAG: ABC transporter ATP-binding protein [Gemmatimonadaceae bacterium]|nr:ABC transporter ATP-binding protein [Gemmatimonadaceae bacterium]